MPQKPTQTKFQSFCEHSTLHGVFYLGAGGPWTRGLWSLVLAASCCLCCYLSHVIWQNYIQDPTLTVVESTQYSTAEIPFPSVTLCDSELVYGPNAANITHLLSLRGYNGTQIAEFFRSFSELKRKDYKPKMYVRKMHSLLDDLGLTISDLLLLMRKPCPQLLVDCSWRSQPYNCTQMFRHVHTMMGHCCQFDITYFRSQVGAGVNFVSGVQSTEALSVVVDGQKVTADGLYSDGRVSLYVIDPEERVTFVNNFVALTAAALFDVNVNVWAIDTSFAAKGLTLHSRRCIIDSDPGASSYQGCMVRQILSEAVERCTCLPFGVTGEDLGMGAYPACTWDRLICIYKNIELVQADIRLQTSRDECFQKCDYVQYETQVEFVRNRRSLQDLNTKSSVVVHFSDTTCMKYRREVLYTWDQMMANLGGMFGLCLGGSIISVIEIIWFLIELLISKGSLQNKVRRRKKIGSKKSHNQVFTITSNLSSNKFNGTPVRYKFAH